MSWFGKLLGTDKAMDTVNTVAKESFSIINNAFYTDQEKAESRNKAATVWLRAQEVVSKQSAPTAISRRIIAWSVITLIGFFSFQGAIYIGFDDASRLKALIDFVKAMWIGEAFTTVMVFYFGAHILGGRK